MLNPLTNNPLVVKTTAEVGQMFIWGVKGQLGEGQQGNRTTCGWFSLFCLLMEIGVGHGGQHVQRVVKVLRVVLQRRQGGQNRECRCTGAREGESAS